MSFVSQYHALAVLLFLKFLKDFTYHALICFIGILSIGMQLIFLDIRERIVEVLSLFRIYRLFSFIEFRLLNWGLMMICGWMPLMSHDRAQVDHIRLLFFQIRVKNLKRSPPAFQFFAYFMTFLTSPDLRTNHSAVFLVRGVHPIVPILFWFVA